MCAVSNIAVFCSSLISCFPGILLRYFLDDFEMASVSPVTKDDGGGGGGECVVVVVHKDSEQRSLSSPASFVLVIVFLFLVFLFCLVCFVLDVCYVC